MAPNFHLHNSSCHRCHSRTLNCTSYSYPENAESRPPRNDSGANEPTGERPLQCKLSGSCSGICEQNVCCYVKRPSRGRGPSRYAPWTGGGSWICSSVFRHHKDWYTCLLRSSQVSHITTA